MTSIHAFPWRGSVSGLATDIAAALKPEQIERLIAELRDKLPKPEPEALKNSCNKHNDCRAAKAKAVAEGRNPYVICCHSEDCEECFGC